MNKIKCNLYASIYVGQDFYIAIVPVTNAEPLVVYNCYFDIFAEKIREACDKFEIEKIYLNGSNIYYCDKVAEEINEQFDIQIVKTYKGEK